MSHFEPRQPDPKRRSGKDSDLEFLRKQELAKHPPKLVKKQHPLFAANPEEAWRVECKSRRCQNIKRKHDDSHWWRDRDRKRKERKND